MINIAFAFTLAALYYIFMRWAFWLFLPFIFSFFIATALQRPIGFLSAKTKLKHSAAAIICVGLVFLVIALLVGLVGFQLGQQMRGLFRNIGSFLENPESSYEKIEGSLMSFLTHIPTGLASNLGDQIKSFFSNLRENSGGFLQLPLLSAPLGGVWSTAKALPEFVVAVVIAVVSCFFMAVDYPTLSRAVKRRLSPQKLTALVTAKGALASAIGGLLKAYAIIMFITFSEMVIGLNILRGLGLFKSDYLLATALVVALVDIVPILGTGTILIPWGIFSLLTAKTGLGVGLLILYVIIYIIRQGIEPRLVAGSLGLPANITIIGMYIGAKLFGFIGLFAVPITFILIKVLNDEGLITLPARFFNAKNVESPQGSRDSEADNATEEEKSKDESKADL